MLKYVGDGAFVPNVPARNLTDEEVEMFGGKDELLKSKLYVEADKPIKKEVKKENEK